MSTPTIMKCVVCNEDNCGGKSGGVRKGWTMNSVLQRRKFTAKECIQGLFNIQLPDEKLVLCVDCSSKLGSAWEKVVEAKKIVTQQSQLQTLVRNGSPTVSHNPTDNAEETSDASLQSQYDEIMESLLGDSDMDSSFAETDASSTPKRKRGRQTEQTPVQLKVNQFLGSEKTRDRFISVIRRKLRLEINELLQDTCLKKTIQDDEDLVPTTAVLVRELNKSCPIFFKILQSIMLPDVTHDVDSFSKQMRSVIGVILNARNKNATVFQISIGLNLFYGHCSKQTFKILNEMGLSCSYDTVIRTLKKLISKFDKRVVQFTKESSLILTQVAINGTNPNNEQNEIEAEIPSTSNGTKNGPGNSNPSRPVTTRSQKRLKFDEPDDNINPYYGAVFSCDNIDHVAQSLNKNSATVSGAINMTSFACLMNRVPQNINEVVKKKLFDKAELLPEHTFAPSSWDLQRIKEDHSILIRRCLVKYLPYFSSLKSHQSVIWKIPHDNLKYIGKKTDIINLGIEDIKCSTTEGTIQVIKYLTKYFPRVNGKILETVVSGDAAVCDLIRCAKAHRCNSDVETELLNGPNPGVGQFHLRMVLLGDIVKTFFGKKEGHPGRGTLPSLCGMFGHDSKLTNVKDNFHIATRFLDFCLTTYICASGMQELGIEKDNYGEEGKEVPEDEKLEQLDKCCRVILEMEWTDIAKNVQQRRFCICETEFDPKDPKVWICCDNDNCKHHLWYHVECLAKPANKTYKAAPKKVDKSSYFCTKDCTYEMRDRKFLYSKAFINAWLMFQGYRDAIRLADGNRMNAYNKIHLMEFWGNKHPKYFRVCHLWQAQKGGFAAPNVTFDLLHNSTANVSGGDSSNLEMDLLHEFLNRYLKNMCLIQYGIVRTEGVLLRSKSHQILLELRRNWESLIRNTDSDEDEYHKRYDKWKTDLPESVALILEENLLKNVGTRSHPGFKNFNSNLFMVENISKFQADISKLSHRLDLIEKYKLESRTSKVHGEAEIQQFSNEDVDVGHLTLNDQDFDSMMESMSFD